MTSAEINQMIIDKILSTDAPMHVKQFILEILRHERSVYDQYEAGGMPRYSKAYRNLLNKYADELNNVVDGEAEA